jgi:hypothetical protein
MGGSESNNMAAGMIGGLMLFGGFVAFIVGRFKD